MGQQTFSDGEPMASVRSKLNGNADDAVSEEAGGNVQNNPIVFSDENGEKTGDIQAVGGVFELRARTGTGEEKPMRLQGASCVLQSEAIGVQMQGAAPGNFMQLLGKYDLDGDPVYVLGSTPLDVAAYSEDFSSNVDASVTTSNTLIVSGTLVNSYTAVGAVGDCFARVENSSTSDVTVEAWITKDGEAPAPGDIFTYVVPRKSGAVNGFTYVSFNDTTDSDVSAGAVLQFYMKTLSGAVTTKGTAIPSTLGVQQNTDLGALYHEAEQIKNARSETPTLVTASPSDYLVYIDEVTGEQKTTRIRDMIGANTVSAYISGSGTNIASSATPTALSIFSIPSFYTSTAGLIIASLDNTGFTTNGPLRYQITGTVSYTAGINDDFDFQIYAGGVAVGRIVSAAGDGSGKFRNFSLQGVSGLLSPGDKIELRVSDNGDVLDEVRADLIMTFAGAT